MLQNVMTMLLHAHHSLVTYIFQPCFCCSWWSYFATPKKEIERKRKTDKDRENWINPNEPKCIQHPFNEQSSSSLSLYRERVEKNACNQVDLIWHFDYHNFSNILTAEE